MQKDAILTADLLDIIFEGRNKAYGAYELRKFYNRRLFIAVGMMMLTCFFLLLGSLLAGKNNNGPVLKYMTEVQLENAPDKKPEPLPPPPPLKPVQQKVAATKYTDLIITKDELVTEEDQLKVMAEMEDTQIGKLNVEGERNIDYVAPPAERAIGGTPAVVNKVEDYDRTFTQVEIEAKYPGGLAGWKRYLERNLNAQVAYDEGAPVGRYTVTVQFIVDREGNISNVRAIDVPMECRACGAEAVKVILRGGRWEPAVQNGRKVTYQAIQHITFEVASEG
ncbi:energy transducer TonB [Segetibacter sp. 3557_3]|uniref:energy transducer TonB n=1 Tax=Segetibacter sp. 3557_3 TaxID=2547429 RepID=UPI00105893F2|nr:energy transducer TonB [Segetibacter sp. 3557_3]TDH27353.1 energy transducer TonB [Segetibacter sp. 3557_3]